MGYPPTDDDDGASELEIRLTPSGDEATTLELVHTAVVPDEMWDTFGPGAVGVGWEQGALGLSLYLRTGSTVGDPEAWQLSDEGRAYSKGAARDGVPPTSPRAPIRRSSSATSRRRPPSTPASRPRRLKAGDHVPCDV